MAPHASRIFCATTETALRSAWTCIVVASCLWATSASSATLERLLMPGPVTQAHVKLESDCTQCHDPKDRRQKTALCLDCHKDVRADVNVKRGFHGHVVKADTRCESCHTEHKGRGADILGLDR